MIIAINLVIVQLITYADAKPEPYFSHTQEFGKASNLKHARNWQHRTTHLGLAIQKWMSNETSIEGPSK